MSIAKKARSTNEPSVEDKQHKIQEIIAKGTADGWYFVTAVEARERTEYIGPVDKDTAQEIIDCEMFCYGKHKVMHKLKSPPSPPQKIFAVDEEAIHAEILFNNHEESIGPFGDLINLCISVASIKPSEELETLINKSLVKEIWFSAHNLLSRNK